MLYSNIAYQNYYRPWMQSMSYPANWANAYYPVQSRRAVIQTLPEPRVQTLLKTPVPIQMKAVDSANAGKTGLIGFLKKHAIKLSMGIAAVLSGFLVIKKYLGLRKSVQHTLETVGLQNLASDETVEKLMSAGDNPTQVKAVVVEAAAKSDLGKKIAGYPKPVRWALQKALSFKLSPEQKPVVQSLFKALDNN